MSQCVIKYVAMNLPCTPTPLHTSMRDIISAAECLLENLLLSNEYTPISNQVIFQPSFEISSIF